MKTTTTSLLKTIMLIALLVPGLHIMAQGNQVVPEVPPSPQAVAFNRLGDYQVSNNYGAPDISIPLFEIDFHGYKIPLALHYEATPLKPGYNYDVTGLGWTLSGNSCVSRTIKDRADEYGYFNNPFELDPFSHSSGQLLRYMDNMNQLDQLNYQYDVYNIVLPTGRTIPFFMYKQNGVMTYKLPSLDNNVQITCYYGTNSIDSFMVKDENAVKYHFRVADKTTNDFENGVNALRNVTWLLTSIDIPSKGTITYEYTSLQTINTYTISEPLIRVSRLTSQMSGDANERKINVGKTLQSQSPRYSMRFLSRISYGPTKVDFNYTNDGLHMSNIVVSDCNTTVRTFTLGLNGSALTSLVISGPGNSESLTYSFSYTGNNPGNYTDYWGNRCNSNSNYDLGNFNMRFDYIGIDTADFKSRLSEDGFPARFIANKPNDLSYYYKIKLQSTTSGETRQPTSPQYHCVLQSITYPNGGQTTFNYENHRFPTATAEDGDFVFDRRSQRIVEGGGFRIESVINWAADGSIASKDYYRYGYRCSDVAQRNFPLPLPNTYNINDHTGCGEAVVDPNLLTFMTYSHATKVTTPLDFQRMALGLPSGFSNIVNIDGTASWWDAYFSASTFRSLLGGRRPVVYPEITVYHGHPYEPDECKSKTVYKYDIYSYQLAPQNYYLSSIYSTVSPDTAYYEPLYYNEGSGSALNNCVHRGSRLICMENPAKRHQLKSKSDYSYNSASGTWELVAEENYLYNVDNKSIQTYIFDSDVSRGHCANHTLEMGSGCSLSSFALSDFYKNYTQIFGRNVLSDKTTTTLREYGTNSPDNTQTEIYSYLYSGVLSTRNYTDMIYGIRHAYPNSCDKSDVNSYIGQISGNVDPVITAMKSRNMLASLITSETYTLTPWSYLLNGTKIDYAFFGNEILPAIVSENNGNVYERSVEVKSYDSYANPTEILDWKTGIYSVLLWDVYGRYLIAMIKNARLSQIQDIAQLRAASSQTRYSMLKTSFQNALIQTWDYIPLVGVSSFTDVNGQTLLYEYDGLGRLITEKRVVNGTSTSEILHQYEYNYVN